jgi:hypothetical protein
MGTPTLTGPRYVNPSRYHWIPAILDEDEMEHEDEDHDHEHDHSLMIDLVMTEWDDFG